MVNRWKTLTTSEKTFIIGVLQGPKYASDGFFFKTRKDTTVIKMLDPFLL